MQQALSKLAFIPFGYLIDQWRWDIHAGVTSREHYNEDWWKYRCGLAVMVTSADVIVASLWLCL